MRSGFSCVPAFLISLVCLLSACSSVPKRSAIQYSAPNLAPVREKLSVAQSAVSDSLTHAAKAKAAIARAETLAPADIPDLRDALNLAHSEIDSLTKGLLEAENALIESQGRVTDLETKVREQTSQLNQANDDKNVALARAYKLDAQRRSAVAQRNKLLLLIIVLLVWIFRKPLFGLVKLTSGLIAI